MKTILIVDDIPEYVESLEFFLSQPARTIVKADSIEEAKRVAKQTSPDIAIIDVCLSEQDPMNIEGLDFLKWLKDWKPDTKAYVISAYRSFDYAVEALNLGAERFLKKPINLQELKEVLKDA